MKELSIGGVPVSELADKYKTPLYVYDQKMIEDRIEEYLEHFKADGLSTEILYASKAFTCIHMLKIIKKKGLSLDTVSGGEIYTALKAGIDPKKIYFHGNNKSPEEIKFAIDSGIGTFIIDNKEEAEDIKRYMAGRDDKLDVMIRINPGIDAHTHKYIITANVDSKFGISMDEKDIIAETVKGLSSLDNISFSGFHIHIGSQIFEKDAFTAAIEKLCGFMKEMETEYGISCRAIDLGGGFGARYTDEDRPVPVKEMMDSILESLLRERKRHGLSFDKVMIEPGRSIVAEAGTTLYTVGYIKKTPHKKYIFVDGGMTDNIRPALYEAKYDADVANRMDEPKTDLVTVAGKCCESGDILIDGIDLQTAERGDILAVYTTGAYGYSMSMRYNQNGRPAVVFVKDGKDTEAVKRETYESMLINET